MKKIGLLFLSLALMLSITLSGCGSVSTQQSADSAGVKKGGTVRFAMWSSPKGVLFPPLSSDAYDAYPDMLIYESMLTLNPTMQLEPGLAQSYDVSQDNKTVTFHLRHDAKWHDGQPFTADDVQYTFEFIGSPDYTGQKGSYVKPIVGADAFKKGQAQHIAGIKIIDPNTISITTDQVYGSALVDFGYNVSIIPKHIWEKVGPKNAAQATDLLRNPVGTGPFKMSKYVQDQYIELAANDDYWNGRPNIDKFLLQVYNQDTSQASALNGDIDYMLMSSMNKEDVALYQSKGLQVQQVQMNTCQLMTVNEQKVSAFKDVKVRQAFAYAINRAAMVKDILQGYGEIADNPYRSNFWAYPSGLNEYQYNSKKAIELLKEAGWVYNETEKQMSINGQPAKFNLTYPSGDKPREQAALVIQQNLKDIGIKLELQEMEFNTAFSKLKDGDFELGLMGMGAGSAGNPDLIATYDTQYAAPKGYNFNHYSNPKLDALLEKGRTILKQEDQKPIYNEAAKIINEDQPSIFLYFTNQGRVLNGKLKGVQTGPGVYFYNIAKWYYAQ